jgi:hypothetical protein
MKTIDIERKTMDYTVKRKQHGAFRDTDTRGKQPSKNKIEKETIEVVHRHIRSFPKMESHYSREKKHCLAHDLNIKHMWCLYVEECKKLDLVYAKQAKYREVFCNSYNYSFFKYKKDQCSMCERYNRAKETGNVDKSSGEGGERNRQEEITGRCQVLRLTCKQYTLPHAHWSARCTTQETYAATA